MTREDVDADRWWCDLPAQRRVQIHRWLTGESDPLRWTTGPDDRPLPFEPEERRHP